MSPLLKAERPPIQQDASGALRVGNSRVLLELVIHAFQDGATPETIVQQYSTTTLADVYAVIAYYLRHRDEVEDYLMQREEQAATIRAKVEAQQGDMDDIRQRLLSRRQSQG